MHRVLVSGGRVALAVWRAVEHNPAFATLIEVLRRHAGADAAGIMSAPFAGPDRDELVQLLDDAGFARPEVRIGQVEARFASAAAFLREEVLASPLAGPVGSLGADQYARLGSDLARELAQYTGDHGLVLPMQTWLATARR
jgi:hypothetical protein